MIADSSHVKLTQLNNSPCEFCDGINFTEHDSGFYVCADCGVLTKIAHILIQDYIKVNNSQRVLFKYKLDNESNISNINGNTDLNDQKENTNMYEETCVSNLATIHTLGTEMLGMDYFSKLYNTYTGTNATFTSKTSKINVQKINKKTYSDPIFDYRSINKLIKMILITILDGSYSEIYANYNKLNEIRKQSASKLNKNHSNQNLDINNNADNNDLNLKENEVEKEENHIENDNEKNFDFYIEEYIKNVESSKIISEKLFKILWIEALLESPDKSYKITQRFNGIEKANEKSRSKLINDNDNTIH